MRKVEQQLLDAIKKGEYFNKGNTEYLPELGSVSLHGNCIALLNYSSGEFEATPCAHNWPTRTTCSRLRALGISARIKNGCLIVA